jgi:copper chaperone
MEKQQLRVNGMSCTHCVNTIETFVGKLNGVSQVKVHLEIGKVDVK